MHLKLGTRSSELALWQTYHVAELLHQGGIETEIVMIDTKGDQILDRSLSKIGSKGVFTAELEEQLREGKIDVAVHSAKDLQSDLGEDLEIIAFTEREDASDVVLSLNPEFLLQKAPAGSRVGTSSTRRRALLAHYYPQVQGSDVRGNLQTRLEKLKEGKYEALVLAYAGVHRMDFDEHVCQKLPLQTFCPPVGQGTIALEASIGLDPNKKEAIRRLVNHPETEYCLRAERAFLRHVQGGCSIPVFGLARLKEEEIYMRCGIISLDGRQMVRKEGRALPYEAPKLGENLAHNLLRDGGAKILRIIREELGE